jgi:hypothetical protein
MKENYYLFIGLWVGVIGVLIAGMGELGSFIFKHIKRFGVALIDHSLKYDVLGD